MSRKNKANSDFFSESLDLEKELIDPFIYSVGGKRVKEYIEDQSSPPRNADYYFEQQNIFIELKTLKEDLVETQNDKLEKARLNWRKTAPITGESILGTEGIPDSLILECRRVLRKSIENNITSGANRQIKGAKKLLGKPDAKGLLLILNDGFYSVPPESMMSIIGDPLRRQFGAIDGFSLFNLRKRFKIKGDSEKRLYWMSSYRDPIDDSFCDFVESLRDCWFNFLENISGGRFKSKMFGVNPPRGEYEK